MPTPRERINIITYHQRLAVRIAEKLWATGDSDANNQWLEDKLGLCENTICEHLHELAIERLAERFHTIGEIKQMVEGPEFTS